MSPSNPITMNQSTNNLNNTLSRLLFVSSVIFALFITLGFTGCNKGNNNQSKEIHITYELPDGWKWFETPEDLVAIAPNGSKSSDFPFVKLQPSFSEPADTDPKAFINSRYKQRVQECVNAGKECLAPPEYKEETISGVKVYMLMDKTEAEAAVPYWVTALAFSKDSHFVAASLGDRADLYIPELTKIISTLKIN